MHDAHPYLVLAVALALILALTAMRREERWRREWSQLRAEFEQVRREQALAAASEDYVTFRVGDLSEGTLSPEHARDIARWVRSWA